MLILFDHGAPQGVSRLLGTHIVVTTKSRGWEQLTQRQIAESCEEAAFDLLFTTDSNHRYTGTTKWSRVRLHLDRIAATINPGSYAEIPIPHEPKDDSLTAPKSPSLPGS